MGCMRYLTEAHLRGFERYKYSSIDTSFLSVYVMHPFWNYCVKFVPKWLAPNVLTFVGFLMTVVNFILIAYYDWGFKAANPPTGNTVPSWVWTVAAINILIYYNLDGMDGKQARRTGTSGPLGELFDHGLDSYSAALIPIYLFSLFGTDDLPPIRMFFVIWNVFLNFYLTHVEKYNTGVMFLPWGYDFTMWGVSGMLFLATVFGPGIYRFDFYGFTVANMFEVVLIGSGMVSSHPIIARNIYLSYKNKTGKMRPMWEMLRPFFAFVWLFVITLIWSFFSRNNVINLEPRILWILYGTIFSNIACRLIVAQMSDMRCDAFNVLMWPLAATVGVCCFPYYQEVFDTDLSADVEKWIVQGLTIFSTLAHWHYGYGVVSEMCDHFNIRCFKITKPAVTAEDELKEVVEEPKPTENVEEEV
ncbi:ethanolaminephosphotransferase 1 [Drosophila takahashii]|uniref:ethanolaminephosphotransferase 1 n=1 Tax=Drosophila takahashii TaxID=29030 RepID=UPI0007E84B8B